MRRLAIPVLLIAIVAALSALGTMLLVFAPSAAAQAPAPAAAGLMQDAFAWGLVAAALATAASAVAGGYAVAKVGAAAVGALAEKPELFGRMLIFVGLAEGIAIYGLIISILILNRLG